jgi:hypothetical protein
VTQGRQSLKDFIHEVEKKVDAMVGESTLNEHKAFLDAA